LLNQQENVVLILKNVIYRSTEFPLFEDFLVERYGFRRIEEKEKEVSEVREVFPASREEIVFGEESRAHIVSEETERKFSSLKILEGTYLDSKIIVYVMGDVICREDLVEVSGEETYRVYTAEYQMIKILSRSGYALQQLLERLKMDTGLKIETKDWAFHRETGSAEII
jgi:hypothetical protein